METTKMTLKQIVHSSIDDLTTELVFEKRKGEINWQKLFTDRHYKLKAKDPQFGFSLSIRWLRDKTRHQSVQDEMDGILHGRFELKIDDTKFEDLDELVY